MAANQKPVYAKGYVTHAGRLYRPGERVEFSGATMASARSRDLLTDSSTERDRAKEAERERQHDVDRQIRERSEKRDFEPRADRRH